MLTSKAFAQVITATCLSQGDVDSGPVNIRFITGEFSVCEGYLMVGYGKFGYWNLYFGLEVNAYCICSAGTTIHETVLLSSSYHLKTEHRHKCAHTKFFIQIRYLKILSKCVYQHTVFKKVNNKNK
jgi:hypothetical protein